MIYWRVIRRISCFKRSEIVTTIRVVDKVSLGQVFSEFFGFPCQYHSTFALQTHIIWWMNNMSVSGRSSET
jgi:hypothetical protein